MTVDRIFVYGSLRRGQSAHSLIAPHMVESQPATMKGRMYALPGGYPGLLEYPSEFVVGDLVRLRAPDRVLVVLDEYEGEEYRRALGDAVASDGRAYSAWCYLLADEALARGCPHVAGGDWAVHVRGAR